MNEPEEATMGAPDSETIDESSSGQPSGHSDTMHSEEALFEQQLASVADEISSSQTSSETIPEEPPAKKLPSKKVIFQLPSEYQSFNAIPPLKQTVKKSIDTLKVFSFSLIIIFHF